MKRISVKWVGWLFLFSVHSVWAQSISLVDAVKELLDEHYVLINNLEAIHASLNKAG